MSPSVTLSPDRFAAVIFDLDGVITRTVDLHMEAWNQLFEAYLENRRGLGESRRPYDPDRDYREFLDGKPRDDGVKSFLDSRGIQLPWGSPDDPPDRETVCGLGNRKNRLFLERLERSGAQVYPSSIDLIKALRHRGLKIAVVTSSKNCTAVLQSARLCHLFDAQIDGHVLTDLGLKGKPEPDLFFEAAKRLDLPPSRCVVVEDAIAGVEAGRRGNFGLVIGVARAGFPDRLKAAGADVVVADLSEVALPHQPVAHTSDRLPLALEHLNEIIAVLGNRRPVVCLDYDGTLTPIAERPEDAVLSPGMRETVRTLASVCTVAIISGRDLTDVRALVALEHVMYAGSHGFDILGLNGEDLSPPEAMGFLDDLDSAERQLQAGLESIPGARVERKRYSVAVHYRRVSEDAVIRVEAAVDEVLAAHPRLRKRGGKKIFELQPDLDWHKGKAVDQLLKTVRRTRKAVGLLYIGDDLTDEDAFGELEGHGIGILVRDEPRPTKACYALDDTSQVQGFLTSLADRLQQRKDRASE